MPAPAIGSAAASIGGSLLSGGSKRRAARRAAAASAQGNESARDATLPAIQGATNARLAGLDVAAATEAAGIQRIRGLLNPYISGGQQGLSGLLALMGMNGAQAQTDAISGIKTGGQFTELARQQEEALLANASATGGLRGGRTQDALAGSRVNLLQGLIDKQLAGLGGLATIGSNAAANLSGFEQSSTRTMGGIDALRGDVRGQGIIGEGQANSDFFLNNGAIQSGAAIARGAATAGMFGGIGQGIGSVFGNMAPVGAGQGFAPQPAFGGRFGNFGFS